MWIAAGSHFFKEALLDAGFLREYTHSDLLFFK
jgi:hypothetical protein